MADGKDWRLQGQEKYLAGVTLIYRAYRQYPRNESWDHDHCEFCWGKFMVDDVPDVLHAGYCTEDDYHWVCEQCFNDFKSLFHWNFKDANDVSS
jgi:hypothetical protein